MYPETIPGWIALPLALVLTVLYVVIELRIRKLKRDQLRIDERVGTIVFNNHSSLPPHLTQSERAAARTLVETQLKNGSKS